MNTPPVKDKHFDRVRNVYFLFALGGACCFSGYGPLTLFGFILAVMGIFMAYSGRLYGDEVMIVSHHQWQIRSFWLANLVVLPIALLVNALALLKFTDAAALVDSAISGNYGTDVQEIEAAVNEFNRQNILPLLAINILTFGLALAWWLHRCWRGYTRLIARQTAPGYTPPEPEKD